MLYEMKKSGWNVTSLEPTERSVKCATEQPSNFRKYDVLSSWLPLEIRRVIDSEVSFNGGSEIEGILTIVVHRI